MSWQCEGKPGPFFLSGIRFVRCPGCSDCDGPNTTVIAVGVRGNPRVPREVREEMRWVLGSARVDTELVHVSVPFPYFENLCAAMHVEIEVQDVDGDGSLRVIPLPLYIDDNGNELDDEPPEETDPARGAIDDLVSFVAAEIEKEDL